MMYIPQIIAACIMRLLKACKLTGLLHSIFIIAVDVKMHCALEISSSSSKQNILFVCFFVTQSNVAHTRCIFMQIEHLNLLFQYFTFMFSIEIGIE